MQSLFCTTLLAAGLCCQAPQLLRDINRASVIPDSSPRSFTQAGAYAYFSARTAPSGRELWRSDGSATGTVQLTEAVTSIGDANPEDLTPFGERLLFVTGDRQAGQALWVSDGSRRGTARLRSFPGRIRVVPATLSGVALVRSDNELWRTDGTVGGTARVRTLPSDYLDNAYAAALGNQVLFGVGTELWRSDGTAAGTIAVSGWLAGPIAVVGAIAYFAGFDGLRSFDGGSVNLVVLGASARELTAMGSRLFWTESQVGDVRCLDLAASPPVPVTLPVRQGRWLTPAAGRMYMVATAAPAGTDLFVSDGTVAGTRVVLDLEEGAGYQSISTLGNDVLFAVARSAGPVDLWRVPAGSAQAQFVAAFRNGLVIDRMAADGQRALFAGANQSGVEPWITDGTGSGTRLLMDLETSPNATASSYPSQFCRANERIFFAADDSIHGHELWSTDGTSSGTALELDLRPGPSGSDLQVVGSHAGQVYLIAQSAALFAFSPGTRVLRELVRPTIGGVGPGLLAPLDAQRAIVFLIDAFGISLWVTDGASAERLPAEAAAGPNPIAIGGRLFFSGISAGQRELMVTDGTAAGTRTIDLNGAEMSFGYPMARLGDQLLFYAVDGARAGLHVTDGTLAGTRFVATSGPGDGIALGSRALLRTYAIDNARTLLATDGTPAGTIVLADLGQMRGASVEGAMVELGGRVLVPSQNGLWQSDGTAAGTSLIAEGVALRGRPATSGRLAVWKTTHGVFATDGTMSGSSLLASSGGDVAADPLALDGRLVFVRNHPVFGHELFALELGATSVEVGLGCSRRAIAPILTSDAPVLGAVVHVRAEQLGGPAALLFAPRAAQPVFFGDRCALYGDLAAGTTLVPIGAVNGRADIAMLLPTTPHLVGLRVSLQAAAATNAIELSNGLDWTLGF